MNKEVILAIVIGFGLGIIIIFGVWIANKSLKNLPQTSGTPTPTMIVENISPTAAITGAATSISPTPGSTSTGNNLTITSPSDETLTDKTPITVSGKASPNATVVILYEKGEVVATADSTGAFTASVPLEGGYNTLTITSVDTNGNQSTQTLTITYSTQKV